MLTAMALPALAATAGTVSGVVRDARGTPQIGALVQLVDPDLSVIAETFTDDKGHYTLRKVMPGVYGVKVTASLFLPTLRENLHIAPNSRTIVNLTLDTLYEAFRWLPAKPRQVDEPKDDWDWTLRLSANKPLLRMLQNGPLVVVSDGSGEPALKARVTIRGGESGFGDGGIHHDFEMERLNDDSRQLILRADLSQGNETAVNTVAGYEQQLGLGRTIRTVAAFVDRPEIAGGPGISGGMQAMIFRTAESLDLTPMIGLEAGGETELVHLNGTQLVNHPFAAVHARMGDAVISYRVSTSPEAQEADLLDRASTLAPVMSERDGQMLIEHGLHQELSYAQSSGTLRMRVTVFHDRVDNPVIAGGGDISAADWNSGNLLYDSSTDTLEAAGGDYSGAGFVAELRNVMPNSMWLAFTGGMGDALQMDVPAAPAALEVALEDMRPRLAETYAAAFGGKFHRAGTEWRASYRWQQPGTVTAVNPFGTNTPAPYLSFYLRQPVHCRYVLPNGMEALVDVRNLLAEGYLPFVSKDGSVLYFAQASRAIEGGLSFTF